MTRGYLIEDIKHLPDADVHKLYKYVRRHMIANIDGLPDPLDINDNRDRVDALLKEIYKNAPTREYSREEVMSLALKYFVQS